MRAWRFLATVTLGLSVLAVSGLTVETAQAQPQAIRTQGRTFQSRPIYYKSLLTPTEIVSSVISATADGTRLFQNGQIGECYLTYYLTLSSLVWSFDDEALRQRVVYRMVRAAGSTTWEQAAVELRTALNDIRNRYDLTPDGEERPLWYRLGGHDAVQSIVKTAYDKASKKESGVNLTRNDEFPYTADRAQRMQKATVDLIKKLSDKTKPSAENALAGKRDEVRAQLDDLQAKLNKTKLASAGAAPEQQADHFKKVLDLMEDIDLVRARAADLASATELQGAKLREQIDAVGKKLGDLRDKQKTSAAQFGTTMSAKVRDEHQRLVDRIKILNAHLTDLLTISDVPTRVVGGGALDILNREKARLVKELGVLKTEAVELDKMPVAGQEKDFKKLAKNFQDQGNLRDQLSSLDDDLRRLAELQQHSTGLKPATPTSGPGYLDALKATHRSMRITYEEFSAAIQVFRESLEMHSIPEKEVNELIKAVEALRGSLVHEHP